MNTMTAGRLFFSERLLLFLSFLLLVTCSKKRSEVRFELVPPDHSNIIFSNQLQESEQLNIITFEYFYNGAGVGICDINRDGLKDIFFAGNMVSNRMYLNKGDLVFEDITLGAGLETSGKWATGVSVVDINQDGWQDIYICYAGPYADSLKRANELYINNRDNTFSEKAKEYGLDDKGHSVHAAFFDYDRDGDLDVYLLTNITDETGPNVIRPKRVHGEMANTDRLYRNNGNGTFTNVSRQSGITIEGYGLGIAIVDINQDNWPDIYISNDYLSNDLLYINNRNGTFTDRAAEYFRHTSYSAMGNDAADYNNDGLIDIVAVDMLPPDNKRQKLMFGSTNYDRYRSEIQYGYAPQFMRNTLQLNCGLAADSSVIFSEIGQFAGIAATDWSWSPLFADFDNDGFKDLFITNGYPKDITNRDFVAYKANEFVRSGNNRQMMKKLSEALETLEGAYHPPFAFHNNGDLTFSDQSKAWGFNEPLYATGTVYADLDNDGDLDLVTNNTNAHASVYRNTTADKAQAHFLQIALKGPTGNRNGFGAKFRIYQGGKMQFFEHSPYRGFQSSVDTDIHVGLGNSTHIDSLIVQWPDSKREIKKKIKADQFLTVSYSDAVDGRPSKHEPQLPVFAAADKKYSFQFKHQETHYADFKIQPLIPHKFSEEGPGIAVGDINGDGFDDFFVGGAYNQSGEFFLQKKNGTFEERVFTREKKYEEDTGTLLFDADRDGDLDLYVASGGNEFEKDSPYYNDRLYFNDGKGNFTLRKNAIPELSTSGSCVVAGDYDRDGDRDLFIGGRHLPHHYPDAGASFILRNDNRTFTDVTDTVAPGLKNIGMVTAALWTDFNNDNQSDLIVVGEWMSVTMFENNHGKLTLLSDAVTHSTGWWNSITGADFDRDGDTDYILGNLGLNSRYKASREQPVSVYVDDLNQDGTKDAVIAHYIEGINRPAHPREDLLLQVTTLKKKFPSFASYADATIEDIFKTPATTTRMQAETLATSYLENNGKAGWALKPLPVQAQFAPVYGIVAGEFTGDDFEDVLLTGNSYAPDVLTGRYDAFSGLLLKGNGRGNFHPLSIQQSGLMITQNAKALAVIITAQNEKLILATQNNDKIRAFQNTANQKRIIKINHDDVYGLVRHNDGTVCKVELYYGSGYLSQSSRYLELPADVSVTLYDLQGKSRTIDTHTVHHP